MSIQNSTTGEVLHSYNIDELKQQANLMRGYDLAALCAANLFRDALDGRNVQQF